MKKARLTSQLTKEIYKQIKENSGIDSKQLHKSVYSNNIDFFYSCIEVLKLHRKIKIHSNFNTSFYFLYNTPEDFIQQKMLEIKLTIYGE